MRHLALIFALMAIALPAPAFASDWVLVADSTDGDKHYIDRQTIHTMPNGYRRGWVLTEYSTPTELGDTASKNYDEFDCNEKRRRQLSGIYYKGKEITNTGSRIGTWNYVSPDSIAEALLTFVCRR